jgi:aspartokinase-like uncharacterized kinase
MNDIRVVKLGGSLLDCPKTPARLASWLATQSPARTIIIIGGGELVEALRQLDRVLCLDQQQVHVAAIDLMSITARLFHSKFTSWKLCADMSLVRNSNVMETFIFDVAKWVQSSARLQETWSVTSDTIAAALAEDINAKELVLLKSALPTPGTSLVDILASDYLDADFINWTTGGRSLRFVNLRSPEFSQMQFELPHQFVSSSETA